MQRSHLALAITAVCALAACGETQEQQALVGAAAGAAGAAVVGGNAVAGAIVGTGANLIYCEQNPGSCDGF